MFERAGKLYRQSPAPYRFAIVKHDFRQRAGSGTYLPDSIPMEDRPSGALKGDTITILNTWWEYIAKINDYFGYKYARSVGAYWINGSYDERPAEAESVICGGNFIAYDYETATHVHLVSYNWQQKTTGLNPKYDNWFVQPWMFQKVCCVSQDGRLAKPTVEGAGRDVYLPLIAKTTLWMNKEHIQQFPDGPDYVLRGRDVYDGDVPLLKDGVFLTGWRLETKGVV